MNRERGHTEGLCGEGLGMEPSAEETARSLIGHLETQVWRLWHRGVCVVDI
jgi:hypothetical protein